MFLRKNSIIQPVPAIILVYVTQVCMKQSPRNHAQIQYYGDLVII